MEPLPTGPPPPADEPDRGRRGDDHRPTFDALAVAKPGDDHLQVMKRKVELAQAQLDAILGTVPPVKAAKDAFVSGVGVVGVPVDAFSRGLSNGISQVLPY